MFATAVAVNKEYLLLFMRSKKLGERIYRDTFIYYDDETLTLLSYKTSLLLTHYVQISFQKWRASKTPHNSEEMEKDLEKDTDTGSEEIWYM